MNLQFDEFIKEFNRYVYSIRTKKNEGSDLDNITNELERKLEQAISLYKKECELIFNDRKITPSLMEIKRLCSGFGKIEYKLDHERSLIFIKKGTRWVEYKMIPLDQILKTIFQINVDDEYYNFIAVYLSQEEVFTLIQIYSILSSESRILH